MASPVRLGKIGETAVVADMIQNTEYPIYLPVSDDRGVDMVVDRHGEYLRVQVKTCMSLNRGTSIEVNLKKYAGNGLIDMVAVYYQPKDIIAYIPYNDEPTMHLALKRAKNDQVKNRLWFYEFMEFPHKGQP